MNLEFSSYYLLIFLSLIVIISYLFDLIAKRSRIPSVLMLLSAGIGLRYLAEYFNLALPFTDHMLEFLGITGLILIVLEATLDLEISREKIPVIRKSLGSALLILLLTSVAIACIISYFTGTDFHKAMVNAIPMAVISSAIAIPSVSNLDPAKKEFIVYEATFSDILGIMLFTFFTQDSTIGLDTVFSFSWSLALVIMVALAGSLLMLFFLDKIRHHVKFFLILSVMILVYSAGKIIHLSSLLLILAFGLVLKNNHMVIRGYLKRFFQNPNLMGEVGQMRLITAESAFLIRTFFFVLFGYSITLNLLAEHQTLVIGSLAIGAILIIRFIYLKFIARTPLIPELFVAPRGLITILLYYSIPGHFLITGFSEGILFFVILASSLIMMFGLLATRQKLEPLIRY